jgi:hypothetical protein
MEKELECKNCSCNKMFYIPEANHLVVRAIVSVLVELLTHNSEVECADQ